MNILVIVHLILSWGYIKGKTAMLLKSSLVDSREQDLRTAAFIIPIALNSVSLISSKIWIKPASGIRLARIFFR